MQSDSSIQMASLSLPELPTFPQSRPRLPVQQHWRRRRQRVLAVTTARVAATAWAHLHGTGTRTVSHRQWRLQLLLLGYRGLRVPDGTAKARQIHHGRNSSSRRIQHRRQAGSTSHTLRSTGILGIMPATRSPHCPRHLLRRTIRRLRWHTHTPLRSQSRTPDPLARVPCCRLLQTLLVTPKLASLRLRYLTFHASIRHSRAGTPCPLPSLLRPLSRGSSLRCSRIINPTRHINTVHPRARTLLHHSRASSRGRQPADPQPIRRPRLYRGCLSRARAAPRRRGGHCQSLPAPLPTPHSHLPHYRRCLLLPYHRPRAYQVASPRSEPRPRLPCPGRLL